MVTALKLFLPECLGNFNLSCPYPTTPALSARDLSCSCWFFFSQCSLYGIHKRICHPGTHQTWKESSSTTVTHGVQRFEQNTFRRIFERPLVRWPQLTAKPHRFNLCLVTVQGCCHRWHNEKMFHQIGLDVDDQEFQSILWRFRTDEPVKVYRLTTITFGLTSSPFLAIRTLLQLAADHELKQYVNKCTLITYYLALIVPVRPLKSKKNLSNSIQKVNSI